MRRLFSATVVALARLGAWALHLPCDHEDDWQGIDDRSWK